MRGFLTMGVKDAAAEGPTAPAPKVTVEEREVVLDAEEVRSTRQ
uniref:Uncharacterized protein n=1 Tax=Arundo donax TaxID=35708 RepID=A0A0A9CX21_ARUDO